VVVRRYAQGLVVACVLWASTIAHAAGRTEVLNGGTCIPAQHAHSLDGQTTYVAPYNHVLYVLGDKSVYCHITMSDEWPANYLQFVILGVWPGQELKARLCVSSATSADPTCGNQQTFQGDYPTGIVVTPPPTLPPYPMGAFVKITNGDVTSVIFDLAVYWERPWYYFINPNIFKLP
jgi:hypothetical protein